jgi:hypothetical protein
MRQYVELPTERTRQFFEDVRKMAIKQHNICFVCGNENNPYDGYPMDSFIVGDDFRAGGVYAAAFHNDCLTRIRFPKSRSKKKSWWRKAA